MQKLGERIRHVRGRMSQEAFAGLLGISKGALSAVMNVGKIVPMLMLS